MDPIILPLAVPTQAHGEIVSSLTLRPINGASLRRHGFPFMMVGGEPGDLNTRACAGLIADSAGIPSSSVDALSPADFLSASMILLAFFAPPAPKATAPEASTTPPTSGPSTTSSPAGGATIPASLT